MLLVCAEGRQLEGSLHSFLLARRIVGFGRRTMDGPAAFDMGL